MSARVDEHQYRRILRYGDGKPSTGVVVALERLDILEGAVPIERIQAAPAEALKIVARGKPSRHPPVTRGIPELVDELREPWRKYVDGQGGAVQLSFATNWVLSRARLAGTAAKDRARQVAEALLTTYGRRMNA